MKSFVALGLAAAALAQSGPPPGCSSSSPNSFTITTVNVSSPSTKRDLDRRQLSGILTLSLNNGDLKDQAGRIGYIASNYQFQFDNPVQAGARETTGFSLCSNGSLALGGTTIWYSCQSGNFYNLYSQSTGAQCIPIHIQATSSSGSSPSGASQIPDGQPQASSPGAPAVTQITDGQPQASKPAAPVTQISDGQPQASAPGAPAVTQISDGQPQASAPGAPVSQISDGQPQASKPAAPAPPAVTQISDGQPQASAPAPPVSQISDGQPQAPAPAPVTQISDGQPQAPAPSPAGPPVSQISDGQPQASLPVAPVASGNFTGTSPPLATFTGAANAHVASFGGLAAGIIGLLAFL